MADRDDILKAYCSPMRWPVRLREDHHCHSHQDGDCFWEKCPQIRDGEPMKTGRHCPLDVHNEDF